MARILIVDDKTTNREFLCTLLTYGGHQLTEASDGKQALELARAEHFDLIITDIVMPAMNGYEFIRELRLHSEAAAAYVPVIFCTANYLEAETRRLADMCGVRFMITKPAEPELILQKVKAALEDREPAPRKSFTGEFDREQLRVLTDKLSQKVGELEDLNAKLEERVRARTAELETANRELEAFSYSVSHDLRAPLRAVDGFSQAVLEDYGALLPEEGQRYLQTIRSGAQKMGMLIDDLLTFSRLSRAPLNKREVNTGDLVRSVLNDLGYQREGRQIDLRIGDLPACWGDPALLKEVWMNLLSNAFKYTQKRSAALVEIGCKPKSARNVFFVRDNGTGFDMRYANKLFGVFQRLHRAEDYEGTGVGLALVQRIIHRHGGRVWAEAAIDRGATFYFTLNEETKP